MFPYPVAEPLSEAEVAEKAELVQRGFSKWTKREFLAFVRGCELYGRDNWEDIQYRELFGSKTVEEVEEYGKVFWERYRELDGT